MAKKALIAFGKDEFDYKPPETKQELALQIELFFGYRFSSHAVCPGHSAPMDAISEAYFAECDMAVWFASRGLGGKSTAIACLTLMELIAGMDITTLGGSSAQSVRIHEVMNRAWLHKRIIDIEGEPYEVEAPIHLLDHYPPGAWETRTKLGNWARALSASETSVRGPHPQRLRLDEVDEMDVSLFESSLGQPLDSRGFLSQTVASSTRQHAGGTMDFILDQAEERGWPVHEWCYRENMEANGGWVTESQVRKKKNSVSARTWELEFENQEPNVEGRAFDIESVRFLFDRSLGYFDDIPGEYMEFEEPDSLNEYITACDWARSNDMTVIGTYRVDCEPMRLVAYERRQREPWPFMIARFNRRLNRYPGKAIHDSTGIGDVIRFYLESRQVVDFTISSNKVDLMNRYVTQVEHRKVKVPFIKSMEKEHRLCSLDQLYGREHTPDTIMMGALAQTLADGAVKRDHGKRPGRILRTRVFGGSGAKTAGKISGPKIWQ